MLYHKFCTISIILFQVSRLNVLTEATCTSNYLEYQLKRYYFCYQLMYSLVKNDTLGFRDVIGCKLYCQLEMLGVVVISFGHRRLPKKH